MEYDNDRKINPPHKTEIFYWAVFAILCPVSNAVAYFWYDPLFWPALLISSLVTLPVYILYSRSVVPLFLFQKRPVAFAFASIAFFVFIQVLILGINTCYFIISFVAARTILCIIVFAGLGKHRLVGPGKYVSFSNHCIS